MRPTECGRVRGLLPALVGQLYGVCGNLTEAGEVVAEALVRAVPHHRTFAPLDNAEAWLRTVAVNVSRTRYRRRRLAAVRERPEPRHPAMDDERLALMAAMRRLPTAQREAIALHYLADLPIHKVAEATEATEATGSPVGRGKARLSRGPRRSSRALDRAGMSSISSYGPTSVATKPNLRTADGTCAHIGTWVKRCAAKSGCRSRWCAESCGKHAGSGPSVLQFARQSVRHGEGPAGSWGDGRSSSRVGGLVGEWTGGFCRGSRRNPPRSRPGSRAVDEPAACSTADRFWSTVCGNSECVGDP
ncbi:hypothetical protein H9I49_02335 [Terrabacter sp. MAHUQ-38]|nr:hypothetical protein [Terrabacter sp. MAHUQ-38]